MASDIVEHFEERFTAIGTKRRAEGAKAYMKSQLRFHGIDAKQLRAECRAVSEAEDFDHDRLIAAVDALFATDGFDLRSAAIGLLERDWQLLDPGDLDRLVEIARVAACWAHVDWLATAVIENVLDRYVTAEDEAELLRAWGRDPDSFWVQRVGMLAQLRRLRRGGGDWELFVEIATPLLPEKEFFIRKAIGWVCREVSKQRPELVRDFCTANVATCSGLTWREATKYLPVAMKRSLPTR